MVANCIDTVYNVREATMNLFNMLDDASEYAKELEERLEDAIASAKAAQLERDELRASVAEATKILHSAFTTVANKKGMTKAEGLVLDALYTLAYRIQEREKM
jgi:ArsR family metal-binding transcriptional regulator